MKILITGSTGLLGHALRTQLAPGAEVIGLSRGPASEGPGRWHVRCDLTDASATRQAIAAVAPDVVIHAQALSDVDWCEQHPGDAERQNVAATEHVAGALAASAALLVGISTDYVFDGRKGSPYDEHDEPRPINAYGRSKQAAERVVLASSRGVVVRPSTLFGFGRANFCTTIVERATAGQRIEAYTDQTTAPTFTSDLADAIGHLIAALRGRSLARSPRLYHISNARGCRRVDFASRVLELIGQPQSLLVPIRMADQRRPAARPAYTVLHNRQLEATTGRMLRPWDEALHAFLRQRHSAS